MANPAGEADIPTSFSKQLEGVAPLDDNSPAKARPIIETIDIEHVHVQDDPRKWSNTRKVPVFISG